jgi:membrane protein
MAKAQLLTKSGALNDVARRFRQFLQLCPKELLRLFREIVVEYCDDNVPRLGASLAFYTLLSLAPLLVVILAIAAIAYGREAAQGQLFWQIQSLVGSEVARAIQALLQGAYRPRTGIFATALGILTLVVGASSVVVDLRGALNTIWHVPVAPDGIGLSSVLRLLRERFYSFALVLGAGFLLLISLMGKFFGDLLPAPEGVLQAATSVASFLMSTALFAAIYKLMPDVQLKWSDVTVGACVTSLLFTIGKQLIGLYLGRASFGSTYGAAGSL